MHVLPCEAQAEFEEDRDYRDVFDPFVDAIMIGVNKNEGALRFVDMHRYADTQHGKILRRWHYTRRHPKTVKSGFQCIFDFFLNLNISFSIFFGNCLFLAALLSMEEEKILFYTRIIFFTCLVLIATPILTMVAAEYYSLPLFALTKPTIFAMLFLRVHWLLAWASRWFGWPNAHYFELPDFDGKSTTEQCRITMFCTEVLAEHLFLGTLHIFLAFYLEGDPIAPNIPISAIGLPVLLLGVSELFTIFTKSLLALRTAYGLPRFGRQTQRHASETLDEPLLGVKLA
eukprot:Platyproteum_vivax@DN4121_c0_g1_i2.p1